MVGVEAGSGAASSGLPSWRVPEPECMLPCTGEGLWSLDLACRATSLTPLRSKHDPSIIAGPVTLTLQGLDSS